MARLIDTNKLLKDLEEYMSIQGVHKLAEYEDLEKQGKLLRLPCAIGDIVYAVDGCKYNIIKLEVKEIRHKKFETIVRTNSIDEKYDYYGLDFTEDKIGRIVFLNLEEAEAKLEKLRGK